MPTPSSPHQKPADKAGAASVVMDAEKKLASSSHEEDDSAERKPHLHAKTFLAVFAVCLIYFAQLISLVGAGAVSDQTSPLGSGWQN